LNISTVFRDFFTHTKELTKTTQKFEFRFSDAPWSESHGFSKKNEGAALYYLAVGRSLDAKSILVIGSGAGFVPKIYLENLKNLESLVLVDAFIPETGNGSPFDVRTKDKRDYPYIVTNRRKLTVFKVLSKSFFFFAIEKELKFDLIFIDGDHSISGFSSDLENALLCMAPSGGIIFHDTQIEHIRQIADQKLDQRWVDLQIGAGAGLYLGKRI